MTSKHSTVAGAGEAQGSMTRQQMLDFFKHREDAYDDLDAAALGADYADHAVIESPTAGVHTGPEAAERTFRVIFGAFLDLTTKVESLIIDGNNAVTVVAIEGTHIGEFLGLPPTGKRFIMPAVFFYQLEKGKIVRERRIYDFTGMLVQIGVLKARPA
jgi:steroid delta-isomerase-like uncharacterized protein